MVGYNGLSPTSQLFLLLQIHNSDTSGTVAAFYLTHHHYCIHGYNVYESEIQLHSLILIMVDRLTHVKLWLLGGSHKSLMILTEDNYVDSIVMRHCMYKGSSLHVDHTFHQIV